MRKRLTLRIPDELADKLGAYSESLGLSENAVMTSALLWYFKHLEQKSVGVPKRKRRARSSRSR